jgi:hypothetical protein
LQICFDWPLRDAALVFASFIALWFVSMAMRDSSLVRHLVCALHRSRCDCRILHR